VINVICDRALLGAYTQDRHRVTPSLVRDAATEVFGRRVVPRWLPWAATAASGVILAIGAWALWQFAPWSSRSSDAVAAIPATVPVKPSPTPARAVEVATPATPVLPALLAAHPSETDVDDAFTQLFRLWNLTYVAGEIDPCEQAQQQGLTCVLQKGSFGQLRHYNRPVILMLNDDQGGNHQVLMTTLTDERALLQIGSSRYDVSIAELSRYWYGDFVLLQRPSGTVSAQAQAPTLEPVAAPLGG
jgi:general secretion pathway protein A